MLTLTGLWKKKKEDGSVYMVGKLGNLNVMVFKNNRKEQPNHPDFNLVVAQPKPKNQAPKQESSNELDEFL